jgi:hypothetical protein
MDESWVSRLVYRSLPTTLPSLVLLDIMRAAEHRNASLGASGILAYGPSAFAQIIEGRRDVVATLALLLESDPRHRILWSVVHPIPQRVISPSLPMGYAALHELQSPLSGTDNGTKEDRAKVTRVLLTAVANKYPSALLAPGCLTAPN